MKDRDDELQAASDEFPAVRECYEPPSIERFPQLTNVSFQTGVEPVTTEGIAG